MAEAEPNPWANRIGCCHACETVQVGDEAVLAPPRPGREPKWLCVECEETSWGSGIWADSVGCDHATWTPAAREWAVTHYLPE